MKRPSKLLYKYIYICYVCVCFPSLCVLCCRNYSDVAYSLAACINRLKICQLSKCNEVAIK